MTPQPLLVLPRLDAERLNPGPEWACISITNPLQRPAVLDGGAHVLRLGFYDAERVTANFPTMTPVQAAEVLRFVAEHAHRPLLVHCEQGKSRSVGIGLFLEGWLRRRMECDAAMANRLVLQRMFTAGLLYSARRLQLRRLAYCAGFPV